MELSSAYLISNLAMRNDAILRFIFKPSTRHFDSRSSSLQTCARFNFLDNRVLVVVVFNIRVREVEIGMVIVRNIGGKCLSDFISAISVISDVQHHLLPY